MGLYVPLIAAACPHFTPADSGETLAFPQTGFVRIESYSHLSAFEGIITRYELRPDGVRQIGKSYKKLAE